MQSDKAKYYVMYIDGLDRYSDSDDVIHQTEAQMAADWRDTEKRWAELHAEFPDLTNDEVYEMEDAERSSTENNYSSLSCEYIYRIEQSNRLAELHNQHPHLTSDDIYEMERTGKKQSILTSEEIHQMQVDEQQEILHCEEVYQTQFAKLDKQSSTGNK
jgi:uncharacterized protein (DUF433 family)